MVQYVPRMKERKALSRRFHSTASVEQPTKPATDHTLERKCPTTHYISVPLPPNPLFSLLLHPPIPPHPRIPPPLQDPIDNQIPLSLLLLRRFLSLLFLGDLFSTFSVVSLAVAGSAPTCFHNGNPSNSIGRRGSHCRRFGCRFRRRFR